MMLSVSLTGCANLNTIDRSTEIPGKNIPAQQNAGVSGFSMTGSTKSGSGKLVHLDAQQRVVITNGLGSICAEPSPDALAAYASAVGFGASVPGKGAGSIAQALSSSAGSIGLRTQSITLMRDALFRICEAYSNGVITDIQMPTLLARSLDLTAVIVAVEQLTGAIAANQVILSGNANADGLAVLISNQELLEKMRAKETEKQALLSAAEADEMKATAAETKSQGEKDVAQVDVDEASKDAPNLGELNKTLKAKNEALAEATRMRKAAEQKVKDAMREHEESKEIVKVIADQKDNALADASASAVGNGEFSAPIVQSKKLSEKATEQVAETVQSIVNTVLGKSYIAESCMAFLLRDRKDTGPNSVSLKEVEDKCSKLITNGISKALNLETVAYVSHPSIELIQNAMDADDTLENRLVEWLKDEDIPIRVLDLVQKPEYETERQKAITDLKIL